MSSDWKTYKLSELGTLARGKSKHRPRDAAFLYGGAYPFIQTGDVKASNHKILHHTQTYSEEGLRQSKIWPAGTVCITIAANIADTGILTYPACFPDSVIGFIPDKTKCDVEFIEYLLRFIKQDIKSYAVGSVQDNINLGTFENVKLQLPDIEEQHRIASILSAFDDKIELNRQTNATLEAIAQTLFREMCLPKGDELPDGWRVGKIGELYKTTSGGTPSRSKNEYYENGTIDWIKSKELGAFFVLETEEKITDDALKNSSAKLLPENSVLIAMYGATVGEISILGSVATCNQAICVILPNEEYPYSFVYEFLKSKKDDLKDMAVGAAQQNISQVVIQGIEIAIPTKETLLKFHAVAEPIYQEIKNNKQEIQTLTALRDSLLPRLMKGEVEIINIER